MICPAKSAQELLAEFRSTGRQEPFEEIVRRYAAMVFHVCFQVLQNRHDAEDATQAVFLTLAVGGKTNKAIRSIGPWLQQVAKRLSLDLRKARKRRAAREQRHGIANSKGGSGLALGSGLDGQELRHILSQELNQLAPKYRLPLILHYFGGLSREQMSRELGCKEATLGVRLHRGREMLAARLSQRGVALSVGGLGLLLSYMVREAVTENLICSTSHVASQMAAGHPVGAGLVSARAMALARNAGNTLVAAKVKAIVASVLIAATAVAAGEVISQVRPLDLKLPGPASDRLLKLIRPRLPQLRSDATPPAQPTPPTQHIVVSTNENSPAAKPSLPLTHYSRGPFMPAAGADWGGSILGAQWIGSATSTHIPGILWSNAPRFTGVNLPSGWGAAYAVGPIAAPNVKPANRQPPIPFMARPMGGVRADTPYAAIPQKPLKQAQNQPASQESPSHTELAPTGEPPPPREIVASGPKLFLDPSPNDDRSHPPPPMPPATPATANQPILIAAGGSAAWIGRDSYSLNVDASGLGTLSVANSSSTEVLVRGNSSAGLMHNSAEVAVQGTTTLVNNHHDHPKAPRPQAPPPPPPQGPEVPSSWAFDGVATISRRPGSIKGYGTVSPASELNQNGQVIADGVGQERTLDLSAVGVIKNSIENSRTGHNGWFAQNKGKLVLPGVAFNHGEATWGEDPADPQMDLINSVQITVDPAVVGSIKLSLLSADRTDYPALPTNLKAVGIWQVDPIDLVLGDVDLTVRYDVDLANDLRLGSGLELWGYDGEWRSADAQSVDSYNHLIGGSLSGVNYFAVAGSVQAPNHVTGTPEPAAMLAMACAGMILARRRR